MVEMGLLHLRDGLFDYLYVLFFTGQGRPGSSEDKIYNRLASLPLSDSEKASIKQSLLWWGTDFWDSFLSLLTRERYVSLRTLASRYPRLDGQYGWIWPCSDSATATIARRERLAAASTCTLPDAKSPRENSFLCSWQNNDVYGKISAGEKSVQLGSFFSAAGGLHSKLVLLTPRLTVQR